MSAARQRVINDDIDVIDVTLVLDTNIYADNDVLAVPQAVPNAFREAGETRKLVSVVALDEDDQAQAFDLIFLNATATLGTINSAVSISDADARKILGYVSIATADYTDLINSQLATVRNIDLPLKAGETSTQLFVAAIVRSGTPTYTASGIKLKLGFA